MSVYQAIQRLEATSSRLEKEAILLELASDQVVKKFFHLSLEPKINFFIKKIPKYTPSTTSQISVDAAMDSLATLSSRSVTGNAAILYLTKLLSMLSVEDAAMIERVIDKNPKCNVATTIVNKVWGVDFVTDVPYMRCSLPKDSNINSFDWEKGVFSQIKADGMYLFVNIIDSECTFSSRNGSPFPADMFPAICEQLVECCPNNNQVQGEVVVYKDGVMLPRKISNGIMNSILHGESFPEGHEPRFHVWDIIPIKEAIAKGKYRVPYSTRFNTLHKAVSHYADNAPVQLIETRIVHSYTEAMEHFKEVRRRKLEGTIVKAPDGIWEDTTSKNVVKLKAEVLIDLKIVGFNAGSKTSKHAHLFGSIQLETDDGLLSVAATGLSDDDRASINEVKDSMIGKIVTICTNELFEPSKNNPKYSVFLPRIEEFREDKTDADTLQQVKDQFEAAVK